MAHNSNSHDAPI